MLALVACATLWWRISSEAALMQLKRRWDARGAHVQISFARGNGRRSKWLMTLSRLASSSLSAVRCILRNHSQKTTRSQTFLVALSSDASDPRTHLVLPLFLWYSPWTSSYRIVIVRETLGHRIKITADSINVYFNGRPSALCSVIKPALSFKIRRLIQYDKYYNCASDTPLVLHLRSVRGASTIFVTVRVLAQVIPWKYIEFIHKLWFFRQFIRYLDTYRLVLNMPKIW